MRTIHVLALVLVAAACGGTTPNARDPRLGIADHLDEARRHEADAAALEAEAAEVATTSPRPQEPCIDPARFGSVTSGGERLVRAEPCGASAAGVDVRLQRAAALHAEADAHRARAAELEKAEQAACAGVSDDDVESAAFASVEDIVSVAALIDGDQLRGARIRVRKAHARTAGSLLAAIECRQALGAAFGWEPRYLAGDPAVLHGADVITVDERETILVEIRGRDAGTALVVYHRAESLLFPED